MYVSVNERNEIKEVGVSTTPYLTSLYIDDETSPFKGWSNAKICCYKVNVQDGIVTMMTPYVDSRLIDHFDQVGKDTETNAEGITDTQMALCDNYEMIEVGNQQITDLEMAICDIYEIIIG